MAAPGEARELFRDSIETVLNTWPVLQIAVDNGFGGVYGQQKADWMVDVVCQYFHDNDDLQRVEVEDFLSQLIDQEFNTEVDDGSLPQVSQTLCRLFGCYQQGAIEELRQTVTTLSRRKSAKRAKVTAPVDEEEEEEEEEMECSSAHNTEPPSTPPLPPTEEDGWTVVRKKK